MRGLEVLVAHVDPGATELPAPRSNARMEQHRSPFDDEGVPQIEGHRSHMRRVHDRAGSYDADVATGPAVVPRHGRRAFAHDAGALTVAQVVRMGTGFVQTAVIARALGPAGLGELSIAMALPA